MTTGCGISSAAGRRNHRHGFRRPSLDRARVARRGGILTALPPLLLGSPFPAFVPKTDADGNDVAGIRLPEIAAPLATHTGWGVGAAAFAGDDLCDVAGQKIGFRRPRRIVWLPATRGCRLRNGTRRTRHMWRK